MLLSVPLTMTAKIALEANPNTQWLAHLLGPADALPEIPQDDENSELATTSVDSQTTSPENNT